MLQLDNGQHVDLHAVANAVKKDTFWRLYGEMTVLALAYHGTLGPVCVT